MRLIIAGGRDFNDEQLMRNALQEMVQRQFIDESVTLICGMARGADLLGKHLFDEQQLPVECYPADWNRLGKRAGFVRNTEMGRTADLALIFWDGKSSGTKHMIGVMEMLQKPYYIVNY